MSQIKEGSGAKLKSSGGRRSQEQPRAALFLDSYQPASSMSGLIQRDPERGTETETCMKTKTQTQRQKGDRGRYRDREGVKKKELRDILEYP